MDTQFKIRQSPEGTAQRFFAGNSAVPSGLSIHADYFPWDKSHGYRCTAHSGLNLRFNGAIGVDDRLFALFATD